MLHLGVAAMLVKDGGKVSSRESYGAMALEVGIENAAPSFDTSDVSEVTNAPVTEAAAASTSTQSAEEQAPAPGPTLADIGAEQVATASNDGAVEVAKQADAAASSAPAPSTAAPSRAAEKESVQSVSTAIGSSAEAQRARTAWRRALVAHIERQKRYPAGAEHAADILLGFRINRQGRLLAVEIIKGSGDARFDRAALEMMRRADPLPPLPPETPEQNLSLRIPVSFRSGG